MTDVVNVVAKLKLTPKGKLQYGCNNIGEEDLSAELSKLCISPFTSRNLPKVKSKGTDSLGGTPEKYIVSIIFYLWTKMRYWVDFSNSITYI